MFLYNINLDTLRLTQESNPDVIFFRHYATAAIRTLCNTFVLGQINRFLNGDNISASYTFK